MKLSRLTNRQLRNLLRKGEVQFSLEEKAKKDVKFLMQYMKAVRNRFDVSYNILSIVAKKLNAEMEFKKFAKTFGEAYFSMKRLREKI